MRLQLLRLASGWLFLAYRNSAACTIKDCFLARSSGFPLSCQIKNPKGSTERQVVTSSFVENINEVHDEKREGGGGDERLLPDTHPNRQEKIKRTGD